MPHDGALIHRTPYSQVLSQRGAAGIGNSQLIVADRGVLDSDRPLIPIKRSAQSGRESIDGIQEILNSVLVDNGNAISITKFVYNGYSAFFEIEVVKRVAVTIIDYRIDINLFISDTIPDQRRRDPETFRVAGIVDDFHFYLVPGPFFVRGNRDGRSDKHVNADCATDLEFTVILYGKRHPLTVTDTSGVRHIRDSA